MALITCEECGNEVSSKAASCPHCGSPIAETMEPPAISAATPAQGSNDSNAKAVAALTLSILGLVLLWVPFLGVVLALIATILGAAGIARARRIGGAGKGMAIAGLIMGIVGLVPAVLFTLAAGAFMSMIAPLKTGAKAQLDAQQLTRFHQRLKTQVSLNRYDVFGIPDQKQASRLFFKLYQMKVLTIDDMTLLAGASGTPATESQLSAGNWNSWENIIFTGPSDGRTLVHLLEEGTAKDGVMLCYNRNFTQTSEADEIVVLMAGDSEARLMDASDICEKFSDAGGAEIPLPDLKGDQFWGKPPFQHVRWE